MYKIHFTKTAKLNSILTQGCVKKKKKGGHFNKL